MPLFFGQNSRCSAHRTLGGRLDPAEKLSKKDIGPENEFRTHPVTPVTGLSAALTNYQLSLLNFWRTRGRVFFVVPAPWAP